MSRRLSREPMPVHRLRQNLLGMNETLADPPRGRADMVGLALTWLGGGIAVLLLIPVLGVVGFALSMASGGASDDPGLFICREQVCVDEMTVWTLAGLVIVTVAPASLALGSILRLWARRGA